MDPVSIAASVVTLLAPFAKDAGKELVNTVGEVAINKVKNLSSWLKHKFASDPSASKDLARFEADPETFESGLKATLEEKVQQDPLFATELQKRIDDVGPIITVFQKIKEGKQIIGADVDTLTSGKVAVTQEAEKVEDMTGFRAKKVG